MRNHVLLLSGCSPVSYEVMLESYVALPYVQKVLELLSLSNSHLKSQKYLNKNKAHIDQRN